MQAEHQQPVAGSSRTTLRVATLNVWYLREPIALANALRAKLPAPLDVLALQEVYDMHDLATFAEALGMKVAVKRVADARVGLSNVLLVCMDEADVTDVESIELFDVVECRAAIGITLQQPGLSFICTHLDHRKEHVRLSQLNALHQQSKLLAAAPRLPMLLLGDFNALRRADYADTEWEALVRKRAKADITSETTVTDEIEATWELTDCRSAARRINGPLQTSIHECRIDYIWASKAALWDWTIAEVSHCPLGRVGDRDAPAAPREHEDDDELLTDHALVLCVLERCRSQP